MLKALLISLVMALAPDAVLDESTPASVVVEVQAQVEVAAGPQAVISGPTETVAGELVILDAGESTGVGYAWKVLPESETTGRWRLYENNRVLVFASPVKGVYTFILSVADDNVSSVATLNLINGGDPSPDPFPKPKPDPIPEPGKRTIVVVEEATERTHKQATLYTSRTLWAYMRAQGHKWHLVDQHQKPTTVTAPYLKAAKGKPLPMFFVGRGDDVLYEGSLPLDAKAAIELIKANGG